MIQTSYRISPNKNGHLIQNQSWKWVAYCKIDRKDNGKKDCYAK